MLAEDELRRTGGCGLSPTALMELVERATGDEGLARKVAAQRAIALMEAGQKPS